MLLLSLWAGAASVVVQALLCHLRPHGINSLRPPSPSSVKSWVFKAHFVVQEDPLEEEMATLSGILAWKIPWTEEPGGPQFTGSQTVGHH